MASNIDLFFNTSRNKRTFPEVLAEIQEYLASKYSTLITDNPEEQHQQITAYIAKYLNDYSLGVEGMSHEELIDKLYTEMAEFSFLTPYRCEAHHAFGIHEGDENPVHRPGIRI